MPSTGRPSYNTLVGLGTEHQRARRAAIRGLRAGVDCCPYVQICGGAPMWPTPRAAAMAGADPRLGELDLDDWPGRIFGGVQVKRLSHRHCNRSAGATLGNGLRAAGITRTLRKPRTRRASGGAAQRRRRARWT